MATHKHQMPDLHGHHGQVFNLTAALVFNSVHPKATNKPSRLSIILLFIFFFVCFFNEAKFLHKEKKHIRWKQSCPPPIPSLLFASSNTRRIIPGCNSLLPSAAAGTVHFQSFLNTELQTPGTIKSHKIWWETEWQWLNDVFSCGAHCDFASRAQSVPNLLQGTGLVYTDWNSGVGLQVTLSKGNKMLKYHNETEHASIKQRGNVQQPESQSNLRSTDNISNLALPQEAKMGLHLFGDTLWGHFFCSGDMLATTAVSQLTTFLIWALEKRFLKLHINPKLHCDKKKY